MAIDDLEPVYDEKIAPLMQEILAIACEHDLPFVATFQLRDDGERGTLHCSSSYLPAHSDDRIRSFNRSIIAGATAEDRVRLGL